MPGWRWRWRKERRAGGVLKLSELEEGDEARVVDFELGEAAYRRLVEMGLTPGTALTVVRRMPGGTIEILARDVVIAVGPELADGILVTVG